MHAHVYEGKSDRRTVNAREHKMTNKATCNDADGPASKNKLIFRKLAFLELTRMYINWKDWLRKGKIAKDQSLVLKGGCDLSSC